VDALLTADIEYPRAVCPAQTEAGPLMEPAAPTLLTVTARFAGALLQLPLEGVTVMLPELAEHE
jgi:hypothetical protein